MPKAKVVEAIAAIDHTGKWIIYGFDGLNTVPHFHETGVTEDLDEPISYCKVRVTLFQPDEAHSMPTVAGVPMTIDN